MRLSANPLWIISEILLYLKYYCSPTKTEGFSNARRVLNSCLFQQSVSTHQVTLEEMRAIHHKLATSSHQKCDDTKTKDIDMNFNLKFDSFVKVRRFSNKMMILHDKCVLSRVVMMADLVM